MNKKTNVVLVKGVKESDLKIMRVCVFIGIILAIIVGWSLSATETQTYSLPVKSPVWIEGRVWLSSWYYHFRPDHGKIYRALNVPAQCGTEILAMAPGEVTFTGTKYNGEGWMIEILQADGFKARYSHLGDQLVLKGNKQIQKGQPIGLIGRTGSTTGCHLRVMLFDTEGNQVYFSDRFKEKFYIKADGDLNKRWLE